MANYEYREDFTKEEIDQIMSLKEKYGVPEFAKHLIDVFKDEDVVLDLAQGGEIRDIRYEDKQEEADNHPISFSRYEYDGNELRCYPFRLLMPKRYYARLLRHCIEDSDLTFNTLEKTDPGLSQWLRSEVLEEIDNEERTDAEPPFLIVMDQAKRDALEIVEILDA